MDMRSIRQNKRRVFGRAPKSILLALAVLAAPSAAHAQSACDADTNDDGTVDSADLGTLLSAWGPCKACAADLNRDGQVDSADLGALLSLWNETCVQGPSITSVYPSIGPRWGGTTVEISGSNLASVTRVLIGNSAAVTFYTSDTVIYAYAPSGVPGAADLTVEYSGGAATLDDAFTYTATDAPPWLTVLEETPDPSVVTDPAMRAAIAASGLPWRIQYPNGDSPFPVEMVLIPGGSFEMGCVEPADGTTCPTDAEPVHTVELSDFYISRTEITQGQWTSQFGWNPSYNQFVPDWAAHPVENVGRAMAENFVAFIGSRLPTEAEWERAYRAGTTTAFYTGTNSVSDLGGCFGSGCTSRPVLELPPNGFGLYGMAGNVSEYVSDFYAADYYQSSPTFDPRGAASGPSVVRGGNFAFDTSDLVQRGLIAAYGRNQDGAFASFESVGLRSAFSMPRDPVATELTPVSGAPEGGDLVTIRGRNLDRIVAVRFICCPSPDAAIVSKTPSELTVTTPAGQEGTCSLVELDWIDDSGQPAAPLRLVNAFTYRHFETPSWATLVQSAPDPTVVTDPALRSAMLATGYAWRVRDNISNIEMLLVPPGSFQRGCSASDESNCSPDEGPAQLVTITEPFYIGRFEVTQDEWTRIIGWNPSTFDTSADSGTRPIESVGWDWLQRFMLPTGLRLPTEAEWEYAYRAGTTTAYHGCPKFPSGTNDPSRIGEIAWYQANSGAETHVVGQKAANALGLHDMAGNVSEWVYDLYGDYASLPTTNPAGPSSGDARGARGGSWGNDALLLRASGRNAAVAPFWSADLGFRVARSAVSVPPAPSQVTPSSGPIAGGTLITITGTNLLGTTSVIVGDAIATSVEVLDAQTIRAVTAPGPAFGGSSSVVVTNQFGVGAGGLFTYTAELPTLSSVAPTSGSNAGGTTITLTGTNLSGATSVMVGGNPATNVTVVSPTSVTAVTPAGAVGPASVSVTTPSGTATLSSGFTYVVPTPTLSSVSPSSGSTAGGTLITLTGTNLLGASSVFVGGTAANNVTVVSSTTVTAVTRPGFPSGPLSVSVTTPAGVAVRPDSFEYIEPAPTLLSVDPAVGGVSGGAIITVKGANLRYVSSVTVGGVPSPSISAIGSNAVRFVVPAGTAGARDIAVTTIGGTATLPGAFTYIAATTGYQVLEFVPDPSIVTLQSLRDEIIATGLPWRILDNQTQIEMVLVPGGTYQMGCTSGFGYPCYSEETPAHTVTISPFYIGRYEITQGQWLRKMGTPPYCQDQGQGEQMFAAHSMSWNSIAGPGGFLSGTALRLPTEAEWEFACRAGSPFAFPYGSPYGVNDSFNPQNPAGQNAIAWYIYNYGQGTPTPVVGSKNPNQYGLHDMTGNVWEWTNDWYAPYTANAQTNPTGPTTGTARVLRGGARNTSVEPNLRCSWRWKLPPDVMPGCFNGFRVARNP